MAWTLCSKSDVTSIHPVNEADLDDTWSDYVESLLLQEIGNPYVDTPTAVADEYHNGDGSDILLVRKPPIVAVTSLYINDALIAAGNYVVFPTRIQLKNQTFTRGRLNVKVSYTSAITTGAVDDTYKLAAALMIVSIINFKNRMGADASIKFGTAPMKEGSRTMMMTLGLVDHLKAIMRGVIRRPKVRAK